MSHVGQAGTHYVAEDNPVSQLSSVYLPSLPDAWIAGMSHNAQPTNLVFFFFFSNYLFGRRGNMCSCELMEVTEQPMGSVLPFLPYRSRGLNSGH